MSDQRPGAHRNETAAERSLRRVSDARAQRKDATVGIFLLCVTVSAYEWSCVCVHALSDTLFLLHAALRKDKRARHMELKRTRRAPPMDAIVQSGFAIGIWCPVCYGIDLVVDYQLQKSVNN